MIMLRPDEKTPEAETNGKPETLYFVVFLKFSKLSKISRQIRSRIYSTFCSYQQLKTC